MKPGFKQTEVGVIPEDWEVTQIEDLKPFVTSGSRGWASFYSERGSLFVRITNLSRESIYLNLADSKYVELPSGTSEGVRTQLNLHDVLVSITADIGMVGYVDPRVPMPAYINQHIALIRFAPSKACGQFLSYFLASEKPQKLFRASTDTGAKAGMSLKTVLKIRTALPPTLAEQEAIAEALGDADALVESLERLVAKKRNVKQGATQDLLTARRRLPGFTGKWEETSLGTLGKTYGGLTGKTKADFGAGTSHYIPFLNILNNVSIDLKQLDRVRLRQGEAQNSACKTDLFFNGSSETPEEVGLCSALLQDVGDLYLNSFCFGFRLNRGDEADSLYLAYFFRGGAGRKLLYALAQGATRHNLSKVALLAVKFRLPSISEQKAIAAVLSDMDAELAALEAKLAKARAIKQGMMQELLTGRIRLK